MFRTKVYSTTFKLRRGEASEWSTKNPILALGEPGFEVDTNKLKIGDGETSWNDLPYITSEETTKLAHKITIGEYVFDGTQDITVPTYDGSMSDDSEAVTSALNSVLMTMNSGEIQSDDSEGISLMSLVEANESNSSGGSTMTLVNSEEENMTEISPTLQMTGKTSDSILQMDIK